jgi:hypothetical protein
MNEQLILFLHWLGFYFLGSIIMIIATYIHNKYFGGRDTIDNVLKLALLSWCAVLVLLVYVIIENCKGVWIWYDTIKDKPFVAKPKDKSDDDPEWHLEKVNKK